MSRPTWTLYPLRRVDVRLGPEDTCVECRRPLLNESLYFDGGEGHRIHALCVPGWKGKRQALRERLRR